jgi:hypothetical protein
MSLVVLFVHSRHRSPLPQKSYPRTMCRINPPFSQIRNFSPIQKYETPSLSINALFAKHH